MSWVRDASVKKGLSSELSQLARHPNQSRASPKKNWIEHCPVRCLCSLWRRYLEQKRSVTTRCPPTVCSWRRAKIVGNLCEVYDFAPLCLVHFPENRDFAAYTCTAQCTTTFQVMHHRRALVELYQCTEFRVATSKFPECKRAFLCALCIMHELRTCTTHLIIKCNVPSKYAYSTPSVYQICRRWLKISLNRRTPWVKFFGSGASSLHTTETATRKARRLG